MEDAGIALRPVRSERQIRLLVLLLVAVLFVYALATVLELDLAALDLAFTAVMVALPPLAWWAVARAVGQLRVVCVLLASAASLWLLGSLVWYGFFLAQGQRVPRPPGPWDAVFFLAYGLALAAVVVASRSSISIRWATLDASIVIAAALALGSVFVGHTLATGVSLQTLVPLFRPVFGVLTLTIVASAALGDWDGVPLSIGLIGLGQLFLTLGSLVYSYNAVRLSYLDDRWANLGWLSGAIVSMLAAAVIIGGYDRRLRLATARFCLPGRTPGAKAMLGLGLAALAVSASAALYGRASGMSLALYVGLAASGWIGAALALRAWNAIGALEDAYTRLDHAHARLERAHDRAAEANQQLAAANVELRLAHGALENLLRLADERTTGGLRAAIEDAGEDLAGFLARYLDREG